MVNITYYPGSDFSNGIIRSSYNHIYNVRCIYNRRLGVSNSYVVNVDEVAAITGSSDFEGESDFTATMNIYESSLFSTMATPPVEVSKPSSNSSSEIIRTASILSWNRDIFL